MSVKHVCPNCGSTLTLDAPMPSLRCPKCKTTMQPETAVSSDAASDTTAASAVRPMRVARTVSMIGTQPAATTPETERLLDEARFKAQQERDRLLMEANKQIQQAKEEAEASLQQFREQKLAAATEEANAIIETASQNAAKIQSDAESAAQQRLAEAENAAKARLEMAEAAARKRMEEVEVIAQQQLDSAPAIVTQETEKQPDALLTSAPQTAAAPQDASLEEQKAKIDKLARQNQIRFWRLNAYVALFILTFICAIKANGNTLVVVLSSLAAIISIGLAAYAIYTLRACIAMLKAEKKDTVPPAPSAKPPVRKTPVLKIKKEKNVAVTDESQTTKPIKEQLPTDDKQPASAALEAQTPTTRKTLLPVVKKKPSKPLFVKKKSAE